MFKRPTVLIIGAGCSAEFGLPVGNTLKEEIASQLGYLGQRRSSGSIMIISSEGSDERLRLAVERAGRDVGSTEWTRIANGLSEGIRHAPSIDNYLHLHRDDEAAVAIGKLAIARQIIRAEERCHLSERDIDLSYIKSKTNGAPLWLQELVLHAQADVPRNDMGQIFTNLTIVTFNYDRVIEHYLYHALMKLGRLSEAQAAAAMSKLNIIHPYGKIGRLPWQPDDGCNVLPFGGGSEMTGQDVLASGRRLRTFTETVDDPNIIGPMHDAIQTAQQVAFMGFSFLPQNMTLMRPPERSKVHTVYGTNLYESPANTRIANNHITSLLRSEQWIGTAPTTWASTTAGQFMHDFGRELTS